jgi:SAM-dependent methyltransferase
VDEYLRSNRALWNEWADINARSEFYGLEDFRRGGTKLRPYEREEVGPVAGRSLLHLQCHFGMDTLSWAREGAVVTGADFSERSIEIARELATELGLQATFVQSGLYELPDVLEGEFDVVYTSRGVLGWLPDLAPWGRVIHHFLKPGGIFYITEKHPIVDVFDDEVEEPVLRLRYPYWTREEPLDFENLGSYADREAPVTVPREYGCRSGGGTEDRVPARVRLHRMAGAPSGRGGRGRKMEDAPRKVRGPRRRAAAVLLPACIQAGLTQAAVSGERTGFRTGFARRTSRTAGVTRIARAT